MTGWRQTKRTFVLLSAWMNRRRQRLIDADETVNRLRPHFPRLGIVRMAEVTGLDRIGIPVWMAVRPNSRTLAVSQGKGVSAAHARASAVMEAAEIAIAEDIPLTSFRRQPPRIARRWARCF